MDICFERDRLLETAWKIESEVQASVIQKDAVLIETVLKNATVDIPETAVFTGSFAHLNVMKDVLAARVEREGDSLRNVAILKPHFAAQELRAYTGLYDFGHTAPGWKRVYSLGLTGILKSLEEALAAAQTDAEKEYCAAGVRVWSAALEYVVRMAKKAHVLGKTNMAQGLLALSQRPPESLFEAMQLCFLYYDLQQNVEQSFVRTLGRLDQLLYPYWQRDLSSGVLTAESASDLIDAFLVAWDERRIVANAPFSLGGADGEGKERINALSYLLLERHVALGLPNVKVHILYTENTPRDFLKIAFCGIREGSNSIVFLNDQRVVGSLSRLCIAREDACDYDVVGCYEPAAKGEVPCSCNGRVNVARAVGAALLECAKGECASFDCLLSVFFKCLESFCNGAVALVDAWEERLSVLHSAPFFSATFDSCIEKRSDVYAGDGAKYHNSSVNLVGLATAVDSLLAIRKAVFEDRSLTLPELALILQDNWQGSEPLRQRVLKKYPKYGTGNSDADLLAQEIVKAAAALVNKRPNRKGGVYRLGAFSIDWRIGFGKRMGASADGRLAGAPLSKNLCASVGANREGATAELLSVASLDGDAMPNGSVLDLVLHSSSVKGDMGLNALEATLDTYMGMGGMAIQYSVLDAKALREAQLRPEAYSNLQVRVCGWNARFVSLSKVEQDEFILQSEG